MSRPFDMARSRDPALFTPAATSSLPAIPTATDTGTILARPEGAAPGVGEGMLGFLGSVSRFALMLFGSVTLPHYDLGGC